MRRYWFWVLLLMMAPVAAMGQSVAPATAPVAEQTPPSHAQVTSPRAIHFVDPEFSELARKKKLGGEVIVALTVDVDGMPQHVRVDQSLADKVKPKDRKAALSLDAKAVEAVQQYRFTPATRDGKPVPVEIHVGVNFQIF